MSDQERVTDPQPPLGPPVEPSSEQVLASLERILASDEFAESVQLSRFLRYAVENRLAGQPGRLKESVIGVAVFRRGPDYDPKADPIVRVEARRLRARLEVYYGHKGASDPVRISLPKGGYAPIFERPGDLPPFDAPALPPSDPQPPHKPAPWRVGLVAILLAAAILVAGVAYRTRPSENLAARFWSSILQADRPVLIVPADTGLAMLQDMVHKPVQLQDYITGDYRTRLGAQSGLSETVGWTFGERRYTSVADLEFAVRLARRPETARAGIVTRFARDARVEDMKGSNLILLGPRHMNPWVELFEKDATFRLEHDEATSAYRILNTRPGPDEAKEILVSLTDVRKEIYGVVNYHRSREGSGYILMVAGTSVAGTEAAADFILDDSKLLPLLRKADESGNVRGFDLLLHGRNLGGSAPRAGVVAFHAEK